MGYERTTAPYATYVDSCVPADALQALDPARLTRVRCLYAAYVCELCFLNTSVQLDVQFRPTLGYKRDRQDEQTT